MPSARGGRGGTGARPSVRLVVAGAVVDDLVAPRRLLAARRSAPSSLAGGWELPGGKVEPGEDPVAALHRELDEELGVRVEVGPRLRSDEADGDWPLTASLRLRVWLARVVEGEPSPLQDHDAVRLLAPHERHDVAWLAGDVAPVEALARRAGW